MIEGNDANGRIDFTCPDCGKINILDGDSIDGSAMQVQCKICAASVLVVKRFEAPYKIFRLKVRSSALACRISYKSQIQQFYANNLLVTCHATTFYPRGD